MDGRTRFVKFDFTKTALRELTELYALHEREGALRTCLVLECPGSWEKSAELQAEYDGDANFVVVKIPSIDGTELWVVPEAKQEAVEEEMGFGKKSAPLYLGALPTLFARTFRDPLYRNEVQVLWKKNPFLPSLTGFSLKGQFLAWADEQIETLGEFGSLAFHR